LHSEMRCGRVKWSDSPMMRRAFAQLANLQTEFRDTGVVYTCPCQAIPMRLFSAPLLGQALGARLLLAGWMVSPWASISTNSRIRLFRVSGRLASFTR
jgi:hypothetical protein